MADSGDFSGGPGDDFSGSGGDGSHDMCSFLSNIVNQRRTVERLIDWLRHSQTTCTDTACFDDLSLSNPRADGVLNGDGDYADESLLEEPFALVMCLLFGLLTIVAMNLARDRESRAIKNNKSNNGISGDNHPNRSRRNPDGDDDDDHNRRPTF